jgi:hypothetical protein
MISERLISCKFPTAPIYDDIRYERCRHVTILHTARYYEIIPRQQLEKGNTSAPAHLSKAEIMAHTRHGSHFSCIVYLDRNNSQRRGA